MKVYLAGPMRGYEAANRPAFRAAATVLRLLGHEVFDPSDEPPGISLREALAKDLKWLCENAETVVLLPNWHHSLGVLAEVAVAKALGIPAKELREMGVSL